jgi:hypothetical protein
MNYLPNDITFHMTLLSSCFDETSKKFWNEGLRAGNTERLMPANLLAHSNHTVHHEGTLPQNVRSTADTSTWTKHVAPMISSTLISTSGQTPKPILTVQVLTRTVFSCALSLNDWYSAVGPVLAGNRAQSDDRYGSGTLHSGQVLTSRLSFFYSPAFRRSHFRRQMPPRPQQRERS